MAKIEAILDACISDSVNKLMVYFQSERNSLLEKVRFFAGVCKLKFERNAKFNELASHLLTTPFGVIAEQPSPTASQITRKRAFNNNSNNYGTLKFIGFVSGNDLFGDRIIGPSPVIALPRRNCFAFLHQDRISLFSPMGNILATFRIENDPHFEGDNYFALRFLVENPLKNDQLIFTDAGQLKSIDLPASISTEKKFFGVLKAKTLLPKYRGLGLACSVSQIFTQSKTQIIGCSMVNNFEFNGFWPIPEPFDRYANVLAVRDGYLYCSGDGGAFLTRFPIDNESGKVETEKVEIILRGFKQLRAAAFDEAGNILLAHKGRNRIEVWSSNFDECLSNFFPPDKEEKFSPTDIALLSSLDGEFSQIVATGDFSANRICLFGTPISEG